MHICSRGCISHWERCVDWPSCVDHSSSSVLAWTCPKGTISPELTRVTHGTLATPESSLFWLDSESLEVSPKVRLQSPPSNSSPWLLQASAVNREVERSVQHCPGKLTIDSNWGSQVKYLTWPLQGWRHILQFEGVWCALRRMRTDHCYQQLVPPAICSGNCYLWFNHREDETGGPGVKP